MVSHAYPLGVSVSPPGGPAQNRAETQRWPQNQFLCRCCSFRVRSPLKFLLNMSKSPDSLPNVSCFDLFTKDPKGCKIAVIQGAHKFMTHVINGTEQSPKNFTFIGLFNQFTKVPVKDYVFQRMTKAILQELALCILQELILYGPA